MNSSEPVTVNHSLQVLEQLESFENSDVVIVICYLIMSISKFIKLTLKLGDFIFYFSWNNVKYLDFDHSGASVEETRYKVSF